MTQNEFFNILMDELKDIPENRLYEIIRYYQNYFFKNAEYGRSEKEIVSELEDPKVIAERILKVSKPEKEFDFSNLEIDKFQHPASIADKNCKKEISSFNSNHINEHFNTNLVLKLAIIILSILILFPIIISIGSVLINICRLCMQIIIESLNLAIGSNLSSFAHSSIIPSFISDFPQYVLVPFSIGTIFLSLFFILIIFYLLKLIYLLLNKLIYTLRKKKGD